LLLREKFRNLKVAKEFNFIHAIDDTGNVVDFANAVTNIEYRHNNRTLERQTLDIFFNGIINSLKSNQMVHYIVNDGLFISSINYVYFSTLYSENKGINSTYCSTKSLGCDCKLFRKINFIRALLRQ